MRIGLVTKNGARQAALQAGADRVVVVFVADTDQPEMHGLRVLIGAYIFMRGREVFQIDNRKVRVIYQFNL